MRSKIMQVVEASLVVAMVSLMVGIGLTPPVCQWLGMSLDEYYAVCGVLACVSLASALLSTLFFLGVRR